MQGYWVNRVTVRGWKLGWLGMNRVISRVLQSLDDCMLAYSSHSTGAKVEAFFRESWQALVPAERRKALASEPGPFGLCLHLCGATLAWGRAGPWRGSS